jgi:hypothetical protein
MAHRVERALHESTVRQLREPPLDEVEPGRARRRELHVPTGSLWVRQPLDHRLGLVRGVVVEHDVDVESGIDVQVDEPKEVHHLLGRVSGLGVAEDLSCPHVHRGEQVRRAVALVAVGHG